MATKKHTKAEMLAIAKERGVKVAKTWTSAKIARAINDAKPKATKSANGDAQKRQHVALKLFLTHKAHAGNFTRLANALGDVSPFGFRGRVLKAGERMGISADTLKDLEAARAAYAKATKK
jgi:hypothetical protein